MFFKKPLGKFLEQVIFLGGGIMWQHKVRKFKNDNVGKNMTDANKAWMESEERAMFMAAKEGTQL